MRAAAKVSWITPLSSVSPNASCKYSRGSCVSRDTIAATSRLCVLGGPQLRHASLLWSTCHAQSTSAFAQRGRAQLPSAASCDADDLDLCCIARVVGPDPVAVRVADEVLKLIDRRSRRHGSLDQS